MSALARISKSAETVVSRSDRRVPAWVAVVAIPVAAILVVALFWLGGGVLSNDQTLAYVLTGVLVTAGAVVMLYAGLRWRALLPAFATYALVATVVGGFLLVTSNRDTVVDEDVVTADPAATPSPTPSASAPSPSAPAPSPSVPPQPAAPVQVAVGTFVDGEHPTDGTATVVEQPDGSRVLTLTGFETDPGPDLRVYVTPAADGSVDGALDLGALKGNKGDQQYALPAELSDAGLGAVVIWCRAFSVDFGTASLSA